MTDIGELEGTRAQWRPKQVHVLFVGESPPAGETFFFNANSKLYWSTLQAFELAGLFDDGRCAFLERFRDLGCYLVDLCERPINYLPSKDQREARNAGVEILTDKLVGLSPCAVISTPRRVCKHIEKALAAASMQHVYFRSIPFPAFGHQRKYVAELSAILSELSSE